MKAPALRDKQSKAGDLLMAQSETNLFSLIVAISFLSIGLAFTTLFLALVFIPSWQVFLQVNNPWYYSLLVLFILPLVGLVKIPVALKIGKQPAAGNFLSLCISPAILLYTYPTVAINWSPEMLLPPILSLLFFYVASFYTEKGPYLYRITLSFSAITTVFILHYIVGDATRTLMWLAFASQFCTIFIVELLRALQTGKNIPKCEGIVLGGKGIRDPLWVAPSTALVFTYLGYTLLWNGNPLSLLP